jgi:hypothetical protein
MPAGQGRRARLTAVRATPRMKYVECSRRALEGLPVAVRDMRPDFERRRHESGAQVLLDVKLRTTSRQSDEQASEHVQTEDSRSEISSFRRWLLRADRRWRPDLVQTQNRQISRRAMGSGYRRGQAQVISRARRRASRTLLLFRRASTAPIDQRRPGSGIAYLALHSRGHLSSRILDRARASP